MEYKKQERNSLSAEMLAKELYASGCVLTGTRKLGENGKCAVPTALKLGGGNLHGANGFSEAYVGNIDAINSAFIDKVDATGCVELPPGKFTIALLPPTGAYLVHLVVSSGDPGDLSGNAGAMEAMGFTQTEIERCLGVMVHEAICREHTPQDYLDSYRGVVISSEVVMFEAANGRVHYRHPRDPLTGPRPGLRTALTTPISLGLQGQELGAPKIFMIMRSENAAQWAYEKIKQLEIKLPIGNGVHLTPAQIRDKSEHGPGIVEVNLQEQVEAAVKRPIQWMQQAQEIIEELGMQPWNQLKHHKARCIMEEGRDVRKAAHPAVGKHLEAVLEFYNRETVGARGDAEVWKELWQSVSALLQEEEQKVKLVSTPVAQATVSIKGAIPLRQIIPGPMMHNPLSAAPALKSGIARALGIEPIGSQHCVVKGPTQSRLQGLNQDGPLLQLRLWDTQVEHIRNEMSMQNNKGIFSFESPAGLRVEAIIKLQVDEDGSSDMSMLGPSDTTKEKEALRLLFEAGHALFMPGQLRELQSHRARQ